MVVTHGDSSLSHSAVGNQHSFIDWSFIDDEFRCLVSPLHASLSMDILHSSEASEHFTELLHSHLELHGLFNTKFNGKNSCPTGPHHERGIIKLTYRLAKEKNKARRNFSAQPANFLNGVRSHNKAIKAARQFCQKRSACQQERAFRHNPWCFSKSVCKPQMASIPPAFSKEECECYFEKLYSGKDGHYSKLPDWVQEVMPSPEVVEPFDVSPITPGCVKGTLKKCSSKSSPGPDGITYHHLKKLPSTHHFLATLFSKILQSSHQSPSSWCQENQF